MRPKPNTPRCSEAQLRQWIEVDHMTMQQVADQLGRARIVVAMSCSLLGISGGHPGSRPKGQRAHGVGQ